MANPKLTPDREQALVRDILAKKEFQGLQPRLVQRKLEQLFAENHRLVKQLNAAQDDRVFRKSAAYTTVFKAVRAWLRTIYGSFITPGYHKLPGLLKRLHADDWDRKTLDQALSLHQSTKERVPYYEDVYRQIFAATGEPTSILDLGCGLNPLSYPLLGYRPSYTATDLNPADMGLIQQFFDQMRIPGKAYALDVLAAQRFPQAQVTFCFKLFDSLETQEPGSTARLLSRLESDVIVASFPRTSLGGRKRIRDSKRAWFTRVLEQAGFSRQEFSVPNEQFFIITRR